MTFERKETLDWINTNAVRSMLGASTKALPCSTGTSIGMPTTMAGSCVAGETPWFKANEQNNSRSHATSDSGPEISLGIALLLLAGFAMAVLVVASIIGALNSSQTPDNFTRGAASPPRPAVYDYSTGFLAAGFRRSRTQDTPLIAGLRCVTQNLPSMRRCALSNRNPFRSGIRGAKGFRRPLFQLRLRR